MPDVRGKVQSVKVGNAVGGVYLEDDSFFILWYDPPDDLSPSERLKHSMWVSLLEHALVNKLTVKISHESEESYYVVSVRLYAP